MGVIRVNLDANGVNKEVLASTTEEANEKIMAILEVYGEVHISSIEYIDDMLVIISELNNKVRELEEKLEQIVKGV